MVFFITPILPAGYSVAATGYTLAWPLTCYITYVVLNYVLRHNEGILLLTYIRYIRVRIKTLHQNSKFCWIISYLTKGQKNCKFKEAKDDAWRMEFDIYRAECQFEPLVTFLTLYYH